MERSFLRVYFFFQLPALQLTMSSECPVSESKKHNFTAHALNRGRQVYCDVCAFTIWDRCQKCADCNMVCHGPCLAGQRHPSTLSEAGYMASAISMPDDLSVGVLDECGQDVFTTIIMFLPTRDLLPLLLVSRSMYFVVKRAIHPYDAASLKCSLLNGHLWDEPLALADGDYMLYYRGNPSRPFQVYIEGFDGPCPQEYLTLQAQGQRTNFSEYNPGGSGRGTQLQTHFNRVRFNPVTLMVKTDDYTFASSAGKITQTYWNGKRRIVLTALPYATARGCGALGYANIDLTDTPFAVVSRFSAMGCGPSGAVTIEDTELPGQVLHLEGDGFCGRLCPALDVTKVEKGMGGDYDNEGVNGGWVLQLAWAEDSTAEEACQLTKLVREGSLPTC